MIDVFEKNVAGKRVYLVEDHHHVLLPWARERIACGRAMHVLCLDHHTDTLPAFTHYDEMHEQPHRKQFDCTSQAELESALADLRHDEHFDFAVRNDLICSAVIFSHVNYSRDVNPAVTIIHDPPEREEITLLGAYYALGLESAFLKKNLVRAPLPADKPYILDIDLDYFKGERSANPRDGSLFLTLLRNAAAVTISRERDWVRLLNMDYGGKLFDYFEQRMFELIAASMR